MNEPTSDPFDQARRDVQAQLQNIRTLFSSYLRIRSTAPSSIEVHHAMDDLHNAIGELGFDLEDLGESIQAVEQDPASFGIDRIEVSERRRFLGEIQGEIEDIKEEMDRRVVDVSSMQQQQPSHDDPAYAAFEQQQQQSLMAEQDGQLESVSKTVGTLRDQAHTMGQELEDQAGILTDFDENVDRTQDKLRRGMKRVQWVIKKNEDTASSCCIGILILALVILLILVIVI